MSHSASKVQQQVRVPRSKAVSEVRTANIKFQEFFSIFCLRLRDSQGDLPLIDQNFDKMPNKHDLSGNFVFMPSEACL